MHTIKHTEYIYEYQDFVDYRDCDSIVSLVESLNLSTNITAGDKNTIKNNSCVNLTAYRNTHSNFNAADNICNRIFSSVHLKYVNENKLIRFILPRHNIHSFQSEYTYRFYNEKDYYDWHIDDDYAVQNIISYLLYLNDDYEGGKLLFLNDKISIKPKKGTMVCFPCGLQWIHKSSKINRGVKKIVWSCFYKGE